MVTKLSLSPLERIFVSSATLEDLIVRAGILRSYPVADLAWDLCTTEERLRAHFDRSPNAHKAARYSSPDEALEVLAKLAHKAAKADYNESKRQEKLADEEAAAADPLSLEIEKLLAPDLDELKILEDIEFQSEQVARELGLPAPPAPGYRHPRYVPPPPQPKCGAKTRKGEPCVRTAMPNGRCRNHGGMSTGPKTEEGRRRSTDGTKHYFAAKRAARAGATDC